MNAIGLMRAGAYFVLVCIQRFTAFTVINNDEDGDWTVCSTAGVTG